jgi:hypothetical protein
MVIDLLKRRRMSYLDASVRPHWGLIDITSSGTSPAAAVAEEPRCALVQNLAQQAHFIGQE